MGATGPQDRRGAALRGRTADVLGGIAAYTEFLAALFQGPLFVFVDHTVFQCYMKILLQGLPAPAQLIREA